MDCTLLSLIQSPVAKSLTPSSKTSFNEGLDEFAWMAYLAKDLSSGIELFNDSAMQDVARQSLESCRERNSVCQDPSQIFAASHNLAVCSLYSELTTTEIVPSLEIQSTISTCLISYCALAPLCSADTATDCSVGSLISSDGLLSSFGVGLFWSDICNNFPTFVNSDIAGVGVSQYNSHVEHDPLTALADYLILDAGCNRIVGFRNLRDVQSASCLSIKEKFGSRQRPRPQSQGESSSSFFSCPNTHRPQRPYRYLASISVKISQGPVLLLNSRLEVRKGSSTSLSLHSHIPATARMPCCTHVISGSYALLAR